MISPCGMRGKGTGFVDRPVLAAVPRPRKPVDRLRFKAAQQSQGRRIAFDPEKRRTAPLESNGSPHQSILHSQDRSIPLLAAAPKHESPWDTSTFAPRCSLSAIRETIRRADLPEPVTPA
jgi:hypothetical protein